MLFKVSHIKFAFFGGKGERIKLRSPFLTGI